MSQQKESYWVQVELAPEGQDTTFVQLDLSLVERVQLTRKNKVPYRVTLRYKGEVFSLDEHATKYFLDYWGQYIILNATAPEAEPGKLVIASNVPDRAIQGKKVN